MDEEGYVLFVRKNAIQVLIPKFGLEATMYLKGEHGTSVFTYDENVSLEFFLFHENLCEISCEHLTIQFIIIALLLKASSVS